MDDDRRWLVANWKMHGTRASAADFSYRLNRALGNAPSALQTIFCPPTVLLESARNALPQNARLKLGAQNCHAQTEGAFTGEISARMLAEAGCRYVLLGHSERRSQCYETSEDVLRKAKASIEAGLTPIVCIGESYEDYAAGKTEAVLANQAGYFQSLEPQNCIIAYEPIWAIGSGKTPTLREIETAHAKIKSILGSAMAVLYGGSVKPTNLHEILGCKGVNGALIGGASLDGDSMAAMVQAACDGIGT